MQAFLAIEESLFSLFSGFLRSFLNTVLPHHKLLPGQSITVEQIMFPQRKSTSSIRGKTNYPSPMRVVLPLDWEDPQHPHNGTIEAQTQNQQRSYVSNRAVVILIGTLGLLALLSIAIASGFTYGRAHPLQHPASTEIASPNTIFVTHTLRLTARPPQLVVPSPKTIQVTLGHETVTESQMSAADLTTTAVREQSPSASPPPPPPSSTRGPPTLQNLDAKCKTQFKNEGDCKKKCEDAKQECQVCNSGWTCVNK